MFYSSAAALGLKGNALHVQPEPVGRQRAPSFVKESGKEYALSITPVSPIDRYG